MKAFLKNYRQSPRKVRLVADLVKGKNIDRAMVELEMLPRRAALPLKNLLASAVANAKVQGLEVENLFVKSFSVDKGIVMKRFMPRAMGRASRINKRTSHVEVVLGERFQKLKAPKKVTKEVKETKVKKDDKKEKPVKAKTTVKKSKEVKE